MFKSLEDFILKSPVFMTTLVVITMTGVTVSGIIVSDTPLDFLQLTPLYVSILIMVFTSRAMRIALLIGGLNSILYAVIHFVMGLYSIALNDILVSFPIQTISFLMWSRRKSGVTTKFRKLTAGQRALLIIGLTAIYIPWLIIDINIGAAAPVFDAASSLLGIAQPILTAFAFTDYTYLSFFNSAIAIPTHASLIANDPIQIPFLIYAVYSTICVAIGIFNVRRLYREQQLGK